ncbi:Ferredoxin-2 [Hibiscus syriacus]|uniref:Ferredoxin-2 n=1 Tax=Hibiscus syriacus TaxID=106335 RepID=A0A6A2WNB3_HIBSY|nr:Ferredoxin-2 [Hibiscus syriacus]
MDLVVTCTSFTSLYRQKPLHPRISSPKSGAFSFRCRRKTTSELQSPVSAISPNGNPFPSIPTHKVTVHDRKQGVVHEFVVPEGYALLCVGFPSSDVEVETQDEDEVYWLQFGRYFARGPIERDDYALELAMGDE